MWILIDLCVLFVLFMMLLVLIALFWSLGVVCRRWRRESGQIIGPKGKPPEVTDLLG
jgi:hypothetical protein